jgi:signal transduction histidine kinase
MVKGGQSDLDDIIQKVVNVLPSAWQYPSLAYACITLVSRRYQTLGYREPIWIQRAEILVDNDRVGVLELGYAELLPDGSEPRFLHEEQVLLSTVAARIAEVIALKETQIRLSTYQDHLRSLATELTLAEERERRSLAISLHDRIGQGLAVAKLKLETLKHLLPIEHRASLDGISTLIKQIVSDTRSLTFEISPPILYELGLGKAVIWLGENTTRLYGLPVRVECEQDLSELTEGMSVMLFRSVQELLVNAAKHSQASHVSVCLSNAGPGVRAVVEDDGVGFDAASRSRHPSAASGFGLFSIRERISHMGGCVRIESSPGRGARIELTVPTSFGRLEWIEENGDEDPSG